jgi:cellulose synthase/poly-beta-1,6-N-acetylglucosamine synthase-like glycosyltransferase
MELSTVLAVIQWSLLGYFGVINTIYLGFTAVAFFQLLAHDRKSRNRSRGELIAGTTFRPISIIVPAHNERQTIASSVRSLLEVGYPEYEVIVVNDGSTDDTLQELQRAFTLFAVMNSTRQQLQTAQVRAVYRSLVNPNLLVIDKEHGGKSDALNAGINAANYPLFCSVDADSLLNADALLRIARPFVDDGRVIAAGGIVRVLNGSVVEHDRVTRSRAPSQLILLCQAIEYVRGFLTGRTALAKFNLLLIISGAFGLFQKRAVVEAGGYAKDTVCEDMELVVRLQRLAREKKEPSRVIFVADPVCWTQVPGDWRSLFRQRDRWQRGLLQTLWIHKRMFFNPRYGSLGFVAMPFYLFVEALGPFLELLGYVLIPLLWAMGLLETQFALLFLAVAVLYNLMLSLLALLVDDLLFQRYDRARDLAKMMFGSLLEFLGYRQILTVGRAVALARNVFRPRAWGVIRRSPVQNTTR